MTEPATVEVCVSIAVSESGREKVHIANSNWLTEQTSYRNWLDEIRKDSQLWAVKTIKVRVPYPISFADIKDQP